MISFYNKSNLTSISWNLDGFFGWCKFHKSYTGKCSSSINKPEWWCITFAMAPCVNLWHKNIKIPLKNNICPNLINSKILDHWVLLHRIIIIGAQKKWFSIKSLLWTPFLFFLVNTLYDSSEQWKQVTLRLNGWSLHTKPIPTFSLHPPTCTPLTKYS